MLTLGGLVALTAAPGAPLALLLARSDRAPRPGPAALAFDAVVLGLAWHLLAGLALVRLGAFDPGWILGAAGLATVAASAALVLASRRSFSRPSVPRPSVPWPAVTPLTVGAALVLGAAIVLRRAPVEFVFMTGDMGEYVHNALRIARGVRLEESFPHLFAVFLALPARLFGSGEVVAGLPLAGLLLVGGVLRLSGLLALRPVPRLVVAGLAALGVVPVWFSLLPVSEALHAPIVLASMVLLVRAHREERAAPAVVGGALVLLLTLNRGTALLLAPLLVAYLLGAALVRDRSYRIDERFVATALVGALVGYAYDLAFVHAYFVDVQLPRFLPGTALDLADRLGILAVGARLAVAGAVGVLGVLALGRRLHGGRGGARARREAEGRAPRPEVRARPELAGRVAVGVLGAAVVAVAILGGGAVRSGILRAGIPLAVLAGAGFALPVRARGNDADATLARASLAAALLVGAFGALHAHRLGHDRFHTFFLYWDRYLFSELLPGLLVAATIGAGVLWGWTAERLPTRWARRAAAALALALPIGLLPDSIDATRHHLLGDAYDFMASIEEAAQPRDVPIVYAGLGEPIEGLHFPNTHRWVLVPLRMVGHRALNTPRPAFAPDPTPTLDDVVAAMRGGETERAFLVRTLPGTTDAPDTSDPIDEPGDPDGPDGRDQPERISVGSDAALGLLDRAGSDRVVARGEAGERVELARVRTVAHELPLRNQVPWDGEPWYRVSLTVEVWEVTLTTP